MSNDIPNKRGTAGGVSISRGVTSAAIILLCALAALVIAAAVHYSAASMGIARADAVGAELDARLDDSTAALETALRSQSEDLAEKTVALESELTALRSDLGVSADQQQQAVAVVRNDLEEERAQSAELMARFSRQDERIIALESDLAEAGRQRDEVAAALAEAQAEIAAAQDALETARVERADMAAGLGRQAEDIAALQTAETLLNEQVEELASANNILQVQMMLSKASVRLLRAALHLADENPGLAKRDLIITLDALDSAKVLAPEGEFVATLAELSTTVAELRQSIDAEAYPITTLEVLSDNVDELIATMSAEP